MDGQRDMGMEMKAMTLAERIRGAFSDPENEQVGRDYLEHIRQQWKDVETENRRTVAKMFLALVAFEFITRAAIGKISIGGLEISDLSLIQKFLPVVVSYFFYDVARLAAIGRQYKDVYHNVTKQVYPVLDKYKLDGLVAPFRAWVIEIPGRDGNKVLAGVRTLLYVFIYTAPLLIEIYLYYRLFVQFSVTDVTTWISLLLTLVFLAWGIIISLSKEEGVELDIGPRHVE
jgi:hypothetical protein